jgi:hypothetical protein
LPSVEINPFLSALKWFKILQQTPELGFVSPMTGSDHQVISCPGYAGGSSSEIMAIRDNVGIYNPEAGEPVSCNSSRVDVNGWRIAMPSKTLTQLLGSIPVGLDRIAVRFKYLHKALVLSKSEGPIFTYHTQVQAELEQGNNDDPVKDTHHGAAGEKGLRRSDSPMGQAAEQIDGQENQDR